MRGVCSACGRFAYVQEHHPDGKVEVSDVEALDRDLEAARREGRIFIYIPSRYSKKVYVNPDNAVVLCGDCHTRLHAEKLTFEELKRLVYPLFRASSLDLLRSLLEEPRVIHIFIAYLNKTGRKYPLPKEISWVKTELEQIATSSKQSIKKARNRV